MDFPCWCPFVPSASLIRSSSGSFAAPEPDLVAAVKNGLDLFVSSSSTVNGTSGGLDDQSARLKALADEEAALAAIKVYIYEDF